MRATKFILALIFVTSVFARNLPKVNADISETTISGISSGGFMAV
jgi:hypothetical protein